MCAELSTFKYFVKCGYLGNSLDNCLIVYRFVFKCYQSFRSSNVFMLALALVNCRQTRQQFSEEIIEIDNDTHSLVALEWQGF